ncbi:hypothetical protein RCL1_001586 [Eukaryota sp. TZLM3-RCL]
MTLSDGKIVAFNSNQNILQTASKQSSAALTPHLPAFRESFYDRNFIHGPQIGKGGFGAVFSSKCVVDDQLYAIKVVPLLNDTNWSFESVLREVRILAKLNHPLIVRYFHAWYETVPSSQLVSSSSLSDSYSSYSGSLVTVPPETNGVNVLMIKTELCAPFTLSTLLESLFFTSILFDSTTKPLQKALLLGVDYLHSQNVIHRDLKPLNILFQSTNSTHFIPKIADFGLAKMIDSENLDKRIEPNNFNQSSGLAGSRYYASPEQLESGNCGKKSDIFSLGLIFFEITYQFKSISEKRIIFDLIQSGNVVSAFSDSRIRACFDQLKEPEYEELLVKMLSQNPQDRPSTTELLTSKYFTEIDFDPSLGIEIKTMEVPLDSTAIIIRKSEPEMSINVNDPEFYSVAISFLFLRALLRRVQDKVSHISIKIFAQYLHDAFLMCYPDKEFLFSDEIRIKGAQKVEDFQIILEDIDAFNTKELLDFSNGLGSIYSDLTTRSRTQDKFSCLLDASKDLEHLIDQFLEDVSDED